MRLSAKSEKSKTQNDQQLTLFTFVFFFFFLDELDKYARVPNATLLLPCHFNLKPLPFYGCDLERV